MAEQRRPSAPLAAGMLTLCQDAERLIPSFPAPMVEKAGSWRPARWDLAPASQWLSAGMPGYTN